MPSVLTLSTSSFSTDSMAILGFTSAETLFYDFSNSELFYLLVQSPKQLYLISISAALTWFGANPRATIFYNPFLTWNLTFSNRAFSSSLPSSKPNASTTSITADTTLITADTF